jgi:hypothetical protein
VAEPVSHVPAAFAEAVPACRLQPESAFPVEMNCCNRPCKSMMQTQRLQNSGTYFYNQSLSTWQAAPIKNRKIEHWDRRHLRMPEDNPRVRS